MLCRSKRRLAFNQKHVSQYIARTARHAQVQCYQVQQQPSGHSRACQRATGRPHWLLQGQQCGHMPGASGKSLGNLPKSLGFRPGEHFEPAAKRTSCPAHRVLCETLTRGGVIDNR